MSTEWTLTFDCANPAAQAGGGRSEPFEARWPRVMATVARLTAAGATVVREDT